MPHERKTSAIFVMIWLGLIGIGNAASAQSSAQTASPESKSMKDGEAGLSDGRYKEARDLFLKIAAADPKNYRALHGAGIAYLYLRDDEPANKLLEQAVGLAPVADRVISYNFAVSDMNLGNYKRAADTIRDYLYAHPKTPDEPLCDALGALLYQTGEKNTATRVSDDARKFYSVYVAMIESKRPGMRKWGTKWFPAAEVDDHEKQLRNAETEMSVLAKDLKNTQDRVDGYHHDLQLAEYGKGVRSKSDSTKLLNNEEQSLKQKQDQYDRLTATIDTNRPEYPQLLLPLDLSDTTAPPIVTVVAAPIAVTAPPILAVVPTPTVQHAQSLPPASDQVPAAPQPAMQSSAAAQTPTTPVGQNGAAWALADFLRQPIANVQVSAQWEKLDSNAKVYGPVNSKNEGATFGTFPVELKGRSFTRVPMHNSMVEARLSFSIETAGVVVMAIQGWGGGGRGGDWQKECVDRTEFARQGWTEVPNPGGRSLFCRVCHTGEKFAYRTDKYHPPLLIK